MFFLKKNSLQQTNKKKTKNVNVQSINKLKFCNHDHNLLNYGQVLQN
jgi:hypothetical protein